MASPIKVFIYLTASVVGMVLMIPVVLYVLTFFLTLFTHAKSTTIVDYSPAQFAAQTDTPFFYSIGHALKYGRRIESGGKTLFSGKLSSVTPSPNGRDAMVVSGGALWIVQTDGAPPKRVVDVSSIYVDPKPVGETFFRSSHLQWSSDSKHIYLIKDQYYETKGSQLFSDHGELFEYTVANGELKRVIAPFRAYQYFQVNNTGIFFSEPDVRGDLIPRLYRDGKISTVDSIGTDGFNIGDKHFSYTTKPFYTFTPHYYARDILRANGVTLRIMGEKGRVGTLFVNGKKMFTIRAGHGLKGFYYGFDSLRSVLLPGKRYFLLNVHTDTFNGQLLLDVKTGQYKPLPQQTQVYTNTNTWNFSRWSITESAQLKIELTKKERSGSPW